MEIIKRSDNTAARFCARHLRLKSRVTERIRAGQGDAMLYTVKVQVRIPGVWVTAWAETCDYSDGDTRPYIKNCAEEVYRALTESI